MKLMPVMFCHSRIAESRSINGRTVSGAGGKSVDKFAADIVRYIMKD